MSIVFGIRIAPEDIPTQGITSITKDDINFATQFGYKIKLLATAKKTERTVECHVQPSLVPFEHPLASVSNEFNALFVKGNAVDDLMFYGKGAGPLPTGSAVLGDIIEIARAIDKGCAFDSTPILKSYDNVIYGGEGKNKYYLKLIVEDRPGVLGSISSTFGKYGIGIASMMPETGPEKILRRHRPSRIYSAPGGKERPGRRPRRALYPLLCLFPRKRHPGRRITDFIQNSIKT